MQRAKLAEGKKHRLREADRQARPPANPLRLKSRARWCVGRALLGRRHVGRLIGAVLLTHVKAGSLLMLFALAACALAVMSINSTGQTAFVTIIAIGLFNSIMFPAIFSLGIEGLGARTPEGSGLLCMAIVGGAIVPLVTGALADQFGLHNALYLPALCYLYIAFFGFFARRDAVEPLEARA